MKKIKSHEIKRITVEEFKNKRKTPITIVLDNVRSAMNVGSIFRTADAFLINKIILCGITACPPNKEIRKTGLGASSSVEWIYYKKTIEAIKMLKENNNHTIAVEQTSKSTHLHNIKIQKKPVAIIFGNEVNGVSQEVINLCDEALEISQFGTKHSLNISVAAGIVTWKIWDQLK